MTHTRIAQEDIIDRYLLRGLPADQVAEFEEHFLECRQCVDALERSEQAIAAIRWGCVSIDTESLRYKARQLVLPWPAFGAAAVAAMVAIYVSVGRAPGPAPGSRSPVGSAVGPGAALRVVELQSMRAGPGRQTKLRATEASAFILRLDLRGLARDSFRVEIVSETGQRMWSQDGMAASAGDWLEVLVEGAPVKPGIFWVRLWGGEADGRAARLREYSLPVEP